jgi:hypothetical protein
MKELITILSTLMILTATFAQAGEGNNGHSRHGRGGPGGHHGGPGGKEAFETCASSLGITLPVKGSLTKLTDAEKESLHACVKAATEAKHAAMDACLKAAGVAFGEDGRPSQRPTQVQMESCRSAKSGAASNSGSAL